MTLLDWIIVVVPVSVVVWFGWYVRRYIVGVSDFLVAGRLCNRYIIASTSFAQQLGLITLIAFVEQYYKTGFALTFWQSLLLPLTMIIALSGFCLYRFRETRALSLGQFLEMRYNRSLRIFACFLRSIAEMMANIIMPALAARFFIIYLDLPLHINIFGWSCPTFMLIVAALLFLAISLIYMGGILSIIVTDTVQGVLCYPLTIVFIGFVLWKFSWPNEIVEVMMDRAAGESFLDPYDISNLRDFNIFWLLVTVVATFFHTASGYTGTQSAAKTPHEAKMSSVLGTWRGAYTTVFFIVIAVGIITVMNHRNFADDAKVIRTNISRAIARELISDKVEQGKLMDKIAAIPPARHMTGRDAPFSQKFNPDQVYFDTVQEYFGRDGEGSSKTQQFITIFNQQIMAAAMRHMLPEGLAGLFCMMIIIFIISTDTGRIYSASSTLVQDCVVPFYKDASSLSPARHILLIRLISIGVGVFFFCGSFFMSQLDYINLFISIMYGMWLGGCGPMIIFGFYSRFGTSAGAWASLLTGMSFSIGGALIQQNWANNIYPWLESLGLIEPVGNLLSTLSSPFNPYIVWEMNRLKFPINSFEIYFMAMIVSLLVYILVSLLTFRKPFNLDRLLHRGKYAVFGEVHPQMKWDVKSLYSRIIGITPEYTFWDKVIAWSVFSYTFVYKFLIAFVLVVIYNAISPWPMEWWGHYFLIVSLIVPCIAAAVTCVWFGTGSCIDMVKLFRDLKNRVANPLDNGMVSGHVAIVDKKEVEAIEKVEQTK